jgi:hypothetical protein
MLCWISKDAYFCMLQGHFVHSLQLKSRKVWHFPLPMNAVVPLTRFSPDISSQNCVDGDKFLSDFSRGYTYSTLWQQLHEITNTNWQQLGSVSNTIWHQLQGISNTIWQQPQGYPLSSVNSYRVCPTPHLATTAGCIQYYLATSTGCIQHHLATAAKCNQ